MPPAPELLPSPGLGGTSVENVTRSDIQATMSELQELQARLQDMRRAVDRRPTLLEQARPVLSRLQSERRSKLLLLGEQILAWQLEGGRILLEADAEPAGAAEAGPAAGEPRGAVPAAGHAPVGVARGGEAVRPDGTVSAEGRGAAPEAGRPHVLEETLGDAERGILLTFLDVAGPPPEAGAAEALLDEMEAIEVLADTMARWPAFPRPVQRNLVAALVARARAVKDRPRLSSAIRDRANAVLAKCPKFAKAHPLGAHINGLQVAHGPHGASWREDALALWAALAEAARPCGRAGLT